MKYWQIISVVVLAFALASGCGDDSGDDGGNGGSNGDGTVNDVNLSVDEDTPADELTADELQDVCGDIYDVVSKGMAEMEADAAAFGCAMMGVGMAQMTAMTGGSDADIVAACEENVTACENGEMDDMMDMGSSEEMTEAEFCEGAEESVADCDATAGEIADCMVAMYNAQMAAFTAYMAQMPECGELTAEYYDNPQQMDEMSDDVETPDECAAVAEKCPEMLEDME
ncbi:MAG: hypothetical protein JXX14_15705 [Deltaproteobacteria bacterium]|nr:hypothetical protein [Deltaproteobacteria bacterium]